VTRRLLLPGSVLATVGLAAAGCGGSRVPSVASVATTTPASTSPAPAASTGSTASSRAALVTCFRAHGIQAALASGGGGSARSVTVAGVTIGGNVDPSSSQFQSAMQACRKYLPGGGPPSLTPAQQAEAAKANARFAACMRTHGVPGFPDPNGQGFFAPGSLKAIDPGSPLVDRAFKACQSLEAHVGPRLSLP
jgi:hypothetical protein